MDQKQAFRRCMEIVAAQKTLEEIVKACVEIIQDSSLSSAGEDHLIGRLKVQALELKELLDEIKSAYIELINSLI